MTAKAKQYGERRRAAALLRWRDFHDLRASGLLWRQIAKLRGVSIVTAFKRAQQYAEHLHSLSCAKK